MASRSFWSIFRKVGKLLLRGCHPRIGGYHKFRQDSLEETDSACSTTAVWGSPESSERRKNFYLHENAHIKLDEPTSTTINKPSADWTTEQKTEEKSYAVDLVTSDVKTEDASLMAELLWLGTMYRDLKDEVTTHTQKLEAQSLVIQSYAREVFALHEGMRGLQSEHQYFGSRNENLNTQVRQLNEEACMNLKHHLQSLRQLESENLALQQAVPELQPAAQRHRSIGHSDEQFEIHSPSHREFLNTNGTRKAGWQSAESKFGSAIVHKVGKFCRKRLWQLAVQGVQWALQKRLAFGKIAQRKPESPLATCAPAGSC